MKRVPTLLLLAFCLLACQPEPDPTQIVVVVNTNFEVPAALNRVMFEVYRDEALKEKQVVAEDLGSPLSPSLPLILALGLKEGADEGPFNIVVSGFKDAVGTSAGEMVVRRKARVSFLPGRIMSIDMHLVLACAGEAYQACERGGLTCTEEGCKDPSEVALTPWKPAVASPLADGGPIVDDLDGGPGGADGSADGSAAEDAAADDGGPSAPAEDGSVSTPDGGPIDPPDGGVNNPSGDYPVQLALGEQYSCARMNSGRVYCWGKNDVGQLGDDSGHADCGGLDCSTTPVQVDIDEKVTDLGAGTSQACAVHEADPNAGNVKCWGAGASVPTRLKLESGANVTDAATIRLGGEHGCYLTADQKLYCWGNNSYGQLGKGTFDINESFAPLLVTATDVWLDPNGPGVEGVDCGRDYTCARAQGRIMCWGENTFAQCGASPTEFQPEAIRPGISGVTEFTTGADHTCVVVDGAVQCWGDNDESQLGRAPNQRSCEFATHACDWDARPLDEPLPTAVRSITGGGDFSCALVTDGRVFCWGLNDSKQLGNGVSAAFAVDPVEVLSDVEQVATGLGHACAILKNHEVRCWGANEYGQLGPAATLGQPSGAPRSVTLPKN